MNREHAWILTRRSRNQRFVLVLVVVLVLECRGNCFNQKRAVNLPATALDSGMVSPPHFDHEKLDVDQLELKFLSWGYSIFG